MPKNNLLTPLPPSDASLGSPLFLLQQSAGAVTYDELQGLTYLQVKGTGLANTCPVVETGESGGKIKARPALTLNHFAAQLQLNSEAIFEL